MKRCWFGLALLLVLLAASLVTTWHMDRIYAPLSETMSQAGERALRDDWGNALYLMDRAADSWQGHWKLSAAFADHEPMEDINALFTQLQVSAALRDGPGFAALCAHLSAELQAMGDAHSFVWWNLL